MVDETLNKFDVVKEGSYLLYDFKDITEENVKVPSVLEGDANGEKEVEELATSPLFHLDTINSEADAKFLEAITSKVPYYHSQVTKVEDDAEAVLNMSDARDPSINDVHAALQEDAFWKEWFTSVWGKEQNKLLLEAYNRLQFPYLNENQYLNAAKFAEIAKESSEGEASQVEFDENNHLNDIVEERLQAIYNLMNYAQLNPQFLDDWAESLWRSGICTKEEAEREKAIFKLQDVKNEILRRKFAGSSSLYKMILNSIDRQGTLAKTTMLSEEDGVTNWSNGRPVRDLNFRRGSIDVSSYVELVEPEDGIWSSIPYNQKAKWKCSYKGEDIFFESSVDVNDLEEETEETENGVLALPSSEDLALRGAVKSIKNETVVWSQLVPTEQKQRLTNTTITGGNYLQATGIKSGHVYLLLDAPSVFDTDASSFRLYYSGLAHSSADAISDKVFKTTTADDVYINFTSGVRGYTIRTLDFSNASLTDLTTLFGITEVSAVTEQMKSWVRTYATAHPSYNSGEIVDADNVVVEGRGRNLYSGTELADAFERTGALLSRNGNTVVYGANTINELVVFDKFKPNTQYTFCFKGSNTNASIQSCNLDILYTDGTTKDFPMFVNGITKLISDENRSVASIKGTWYTSQTTLDLDESYICIGTEYTPHFTSTLSLSFLNSVPGIGIKDTVIDLENQTVAWTYVKRNLAADFSWRSSYSEGSGTAWQTIDPITDILTPLDNSTVAEVIAANYVATTRDLQYYGENGLIAIDVNKRFQVNSAESPTGEVVYKLATPITKTFKELGITIPDSWDGGKLRVEAGGEVSLVGNGLGEAEISYYTYPADAIIPTKVTPAHEGDDYTISAPYSPKNLKVEGTWKPQFINSYVDFSGLTFTLDPYEETLEGMDAITAIHENAEVPLNLTLPMFYESTIDVEDLEDPSEHLRGSEDEVIDFDALEGRHTSEGIPSNTVLDIQADHILYHENSVQKRLGAAYPFPTKEGTSISLMDSTWMDYVEDIAEDRQRPSEEIKVGAQISLVAESTSLKLFSISGNELLYGTDTVTELTTAEKPSIFSDDEIVGATYYTGTIPFEDEGCYWREGLYDASQPTVNVLQYFNNTTEVWSDFFNPNEASAVADANHILAEMKSSGHKNYSCTAGEDEFEPDVETRVLAYNSTLSPDASTKLGVQSILDGSEITDLSDKTVLVSSEEYEGGIAINTILTDNAVTERHFNSNPTSEKDGNELTLTINLPAESGITYSAELDPVLQLDSSIAFADSLRIGDNLKRSVEDEKVKVKHNTNSRKLVSDNYIVLPFTAGSNSLSKLNMKDNTLSFIFNILTSAESYYTEMRYPIPTFLGNTTRIANKWTGIRTLKEGSYFITCKYPALIAPFTEEDLNQKKAIPTVLASRFKITVESELRELIARDADELDPTLDDYTYNHFENQIRSYNSTDNKTFPHRIMKIRLYVQDQVSGNMTWTLIGSNIESEATGNVILLDKSSVSLAPRKDIPAFVVPSYTSGFYTENEGTVVPNISSIELENGESYRLILDYTANVTELSFIEGVYSSMSDEIPEYSKSVDLLDGNALVKEYIYSNASAPWAYSSDTMYLVRSGFNTKTVNNEVQWADNTGLSLAFREYTKPEGVYFDTTNNRLTNLAGTVINNIYDITNWTESTGFPGNAVLLTPSTFNSENTYYRVAETSDHLQYWQGVTNFAPAAAGLYYKSGDDFIVIDDDRRVDRTVTYYTGSLDSWTLGNPYSESSSKNDLLANFYPTFGRNSINDCPFIPYIYLGYHVKDFSVARGGFRKTTKTLGQTIKKGELEYAQEIYNGIRSRIRNAITNLTASPSGVFEALGSIEIQGTQTLSEYQLLTRVSEERVFPTTNLGEVVVCDELYGNNLIQDQEFNNTNSWTVSNVGLYEPDNTWKTGKDVYVINTATTDPIILTYYFSNPIDAGVTEKAISVKNAKVGTFSGDNFIEWTSAAAPGEGWLTYSKQDDSCVSADRSSITFTLIPNGYDEDENLLPVCITKAVCRMNHETTWTPGLSNVIFNRGTGALRIPSFLYMTLKTASSYHPLLLKSKNLGSVASIPATEIVTFLSGYKKFEKKAYSYYVSPWKKQLSVTVGTAITSTVLDLGAINGKEASTGSNKQDFITDVTVTRSGKVLTVIAELEDFFEGLNVHVKEGTNCFLFKDECITGSGNTSNDVEDSNFSVVSDPINGDLVVVDGIAIYQGSEMLYDFRFLPIIYNRKKHHLSVNILIPN